MRLRGARDVAGQGGCGQRHLPPWPGRVFRFTISAGGDMLTITTTPDHHRREGSPGPGPAASPGQNHRGQAATRSGRPGHPPATDGGRRADVDEFYRILDQLAASWAGHGACVSAPAVPAARRRACTSSTRTARTALTAAAGWCASAPTR